MHVATANRRRLLFALLYFNEGAPIGLVWLALPALLRAEGVPVERIGALLALVVLPWTLKFLAGPLVDRLAAVRGASRGLLMATQAGMAATLVAAAGYNSSAELDWLAGLLVVHAICAALQDVSIDALAIRITTPAERGRLNAAMQLGLYAGRSLAAGIALGALWGLAWRDACLALAAIQVATLVIIALLHWPAKASSDEQASWHTVRNALLGVLARRSTWGALAFAGLAGAGYEATAALAGPWLIDHDTTTTAIGRWQALGVPLMIVVGSQLGGLLADWRGHRLATAVGLLGFVTAILLLALAAGVFDMPLGGVLTWVILAAMYAAVGVFTVSSYALFMDLTDPRVGGTQFSAYMSATNACEAWSLALGGLLAARIGYAGAVSLLCLVSLACLALLPWLKLKPTAGAESPEHVVANA